MSDVHSCIVHTRALSCLCVCVCVCVANKGRGYSELHLRELRETALPALEVCTLCVCVCVMVCS